MLAQAGFSGAAAGSATPQAADWQIVKIKTRDIAPATWAFGS